jgi:hypothetical protein
MVKNPHSDTDFYKDTKCKCGRLPARKGCFNAKISHHAPKSG